MKDLLPLTSMQGHAPSELKTNAAMKTSAETDLTAIVSGISANQPNDKTSFINSLNDLLQSSLTLDDMVIPAGNGGKTLPLSTPAAEPVRSDTLPMLAAEQTQADTVLISAFALEPSQTVAPQTDNASTASNASALSDLTKLIAKTAYHSTNVATPGESLPTVNRPVATEQPGAGQTMQAMNTMNTAETAMITPLSTMRPPALTQDLEQTTDPTKRTVTVKSNLPHAFGQAELADHQQAVKGETLVSETDRLFTSRMQSVSVSPTLELSNHKLVAETVLNTTQPASTDVLNASLARSPIPQTGVPAESMATNSQSAISETLGRADWGQGMGKQILWMVNQNISRAEIRLNPANLGPLEVRIDMDNDQVNVAFSSRHAEVRDAVEQALPRLREMLEEKGLNLSDTDVSQHSFAEQRNNAFAQADQNNNGFTLGRSFEVMDDQPLGDTGQGPLAQATGDASLSGLVDYYI